jgi:hypothetical protein
LFSLPMSHASAFSCSFVIPTPSINPHIHSNQHISMLTAFAYIFFPSLLSQSPQVFVGKDGVHYQLTHINLDFVGLPGWTFHQSPSNIALLSFFPFGLQCWSAHPSLPAGPRLVIRIEFCDRYISCIMCTCFWTYYILYASYSPITFPSPPTRPLFSRREKTTEPVSVKRMDGERFKERKHCLVPTFLFGTSRPSGG